MKRILLVSTNTVKEPYPVPPVGLCQLAAVLEREYEVRVFDANTSGPDGLEAAITEFAPDYVGVGVRNVDNVIMEAPEFYLDAVRDDFVERIRACTSVPIIIGGSGFSILPKEMLAFLGGDYGVVGEGETAFPVLLHALGNGGDPASIPHVVSTAAPEAEPGASDTCIDPASLPFARIDTRLDYAPYLRGAYPIQMKRGCARQCVYCTYPGIEGTRLRQRTATRIVDELCDTRDRLGDITFEFVDSTFNDPPELALAVCREIAARGLRFQLRTMGMNPRHITPELCEAMKAAGFVQMDVTPDTASPAVLEGMRKGFTRECLEHGAEIMRELDMPGKWFFIFGGPNETEETVAETFDFIDRFVHEDDPAHITEGVRIYPGTELERAALRDGVLEPGDSLLRPRYYVSPAIGREGLHEAIERHVSGRPNCLRASEMRPPEALIRAAVMLRQQERLTEPMFRTLIRLRRQYWGRLDELEAPRA